MAERVCPWWVGYLLLVPLRRLFHDPVTILSPHVRAGMMVLDVGCAMGFFSLPLAKIVGPGGRVVCVDLQERMLVRLRKRAERAGLSDGIETRVCRERSLGVDDLKGSVDFGLAFAVVHEVPDAPALLAEMHSVLRPGGRLFLSEPRGHVKEAAFEATLTTATTAGLSLLERPSLKGSRAAVLEKPRDSTS